MNFTVYLDGFASESQKKYTLIEGVYLEILVEQPSHQISNDVYLLNQLYVECEKLLVSELTQTQSILKAGIKSNQESTQEPAQTQIDLQKFVLILKSIKHIVSSKVNKDLSSSVVLLVLHLIENLKKDELSLDLQELFLFAFEIMSTNTSHVTHHHFLLTYYLDSPTLQRFRICPVLALNV